MQGLRIEAYVNSERFDAKQIIATGARTTPMIEIPPSHNKKLLETPEKWQKEDVNKGGNLEKVQGATRLGETGLRASERENCLWEGLWEDLWKSLKNLWKISEKSLKTSEKSLKTSEKSLKTSQRPSHRQISLSEADFPLRGSRSCCPYSVALKLSPRNRSDSKSLRFQSASRLDLKSPAVWASKLSIQEELTTKLAWTSPPSWCPPAPAKIKIRSFFAYSWKLPSYNGAFSLTVDLFSFLLTIGLRWPAGSQRELGRFARINSQKNPYFHNVRAIGANRLKPAIRNS